MSKLGRRPFPRRLFLTGAAGVTVGLPFLDVLTDGIVEGFDVAVGKREAH